MRLDCNFQNVLQKCWNKECDAKDEFIAVCAAIANTIETQESISAPAVALCFYNLSRNGSHDNLKDWMFSHGCIDCGEKLYQVFVQAVDAVMKVTELNRDQAVRPEQAEQLLFALQALKA